MNEDQLVKAIEAAARRLPPVRLGIGDDAALVDVREGCELAVCVDTLNEGVHFPADVAPADLGHKALAVNLSDLAAMGADPAWALLSLSLQQVEERWLGQFLDGFCDLAERFRVALAGGDSTKGPLAVSVTVAGSVKRGEALVRGASSAGDDLWVSGTLGDAAAALGGCPDEFLDARLHRPEPRVALGQALRGLATSCIDLSDGLRRDLPRLLPSGRGAQVDVFALPRSEALRAAADDRRTLSWAMVGGDDYELCFTAAPEHGDAVRDAGRRARVTVTRIGMVTRDSELRWLDRHGQPFEPESAGFEHF